VRNKFVIAAFLIVGAASVAYAAFAQNLVVNGTGTATGNWDVQITAITLASATGASNHNAVAPTVAGDNLSATFSVDLAYPGATATYDVTIKNNGNINAKLSTLTDLTSINSGAPTYITYAITGVAVNDALAPAATTTAHVAVTWAASASTNPAGANKAATITFGYIQN
jgi:uncharacterized repeat protein (TIGR01451 family)